eukprot:TRINITY_DN12475_c0_g7_i1.p1 TRINITY_DN12475_c0_g7~~TRINITY_DN12475_c0_g7_i1.p1  ORF type:complete len:406 (+),score=39.96 TRINITY_DN12475_c0_g7_i1:45-1262(+)
MANSAGKPISLSSKKTSKRNGSRRGPTLTSIGGLPSINAPKLPTLRKDVLTQTTNVSQPFHGNSSNHVKQAESDKAQLASSKGLHQSEAQSKKARIIIDLDSSNEDSDQSGAEPLPQTSPQRNGNQAPVREVMVLGCNSDDDDNDSGDHTSNNAAATLLPCPICSQRFPQADIQHHANSCLSQYEAGRTSTQPSHKRTTASTDSTTSREPVAKRDSKSTGSDLAAAVETDIFRNFDGVTCPICQQKLGKTKRAKLNHLKSCSKKHSLGAADLIALLRSSCPELLQPSQPSSGGSSRDFKSPAIKRAHKEDSTKEGPSKRASKPTKSRKAKPKAKAKRRGRKPVECYLIPSSQSDLHLRMQRRRLLPQSQMIYTLKKCVPFLSISSGTGRTSVFEARIVDIFLAEM